MNEPAQSPEVPAEPRGASSAAAASAASAAPTALAERNVGRWLIVLAALMWSTSGFFVKAPIFAGWPGITLACWRAAFATACLLPAVRKPSWSWGLVPMLMTFIAMNVTFLTSMSWTAAGNAIWLQNTAPVWVVLASVFLLREPVPRADWLMLSFCLAGVGVILACTLGGDDAAGVVVGLWGGFFFAGVVLSLRLLRAMESTWLIALNHLVTAVVLAPSLWIFNTWPTGQQWIYLAAFGGLQMGIPYVIYAQGLKRIPGHEAAGIGLLEPVLVPLWVYLAWGDVPQWWTLAGGALILLGLAVRYVRVSARQPARQRP